MPDLVTAAQLKLFAPRCDYLALGPALSRAAAEFGINTSQRLAHWLGQLHHESAGLTRMEESLAYSAERLMAVWPRRFPTLEIARSLAGNAKLIADRVYGGRMGNGPAGSGDGWRYRGRGLMQVTGRANYERVGREIGVDLVAQPDLLMTPAVAAQSAAAFWSIEGLNALADRDQVEAITRVINGGLNGLEERRRQVTRARAIWRG